MSSAIEKQAPAISLVISILALAVALVPQYKKLLGVGSPKGETPPPAAVGGPMGGPGGPMGGGPGGMGPMGGGPGGMGGMGPMGGGFGAPPAPDPELIALYRRRVELMDQQISSIPTADIRLQRDLAKLMLLRQEAGGRRIMPGASEAFLKLLVLKASQADKLAINQAEIDLLTLTGRLRNKEAFKEAQEAFGEYPNVPVSDDKLSALLQAEQSPPMP
jgi:hypothetical protein